MTDWMELDELLDGIAAEEKARAVGEVSEVGPIDLGPTAQEDAPAQRVQPVPTRAQLVDSMKAHMDSPRGRTHTVSVRVNPVEREQWRAAAKRDGRSQLGRWVREVVDDHLKGAQVAAKASPAKVKSARTDALLDLAEQLSRIGNNLNQIARRVNIDDVLYLEDLQEITAMKARTDAVLHAAMAEIGGA